MTKTVAVALSGGVDSAVTAALLLEQGYNVIGITGKMTCTEDSKQVVLNAQNVAEKLGIEHYVVDVSKEFDEKIIKYFEESYRNGKTPNPCIMCNKHTGITVYNKVREMTLQSHQSTSDLINQLIR